MVIISLNRVAHASHRCRTPALFITKVGQENRCRHKTWPGHGVLHCWHRLIHWSWWMCADGLLSVSHLHCRWGSQYFGGECIRMHKPCVIATPRHPWCVLLYIVFANTLHCAPWWESHWVWVTTTGLPSHEHLQLLLLKGWEKLSVSVSYEICLSRQKQYT